MWVSVNGGVSGVGQEAERNDYYHIVKYLQLSLFVVEYILGWTTNCYRRDADRDGKHEWVATVITGRRGTAMGRE